MVHPVKTPLGVVRAVTRFSLHAARHPVRTVGDAARVGLGVVGSVVTTLRPEHHPVAVDMDGAVAEPAPADAWATVKKQGDPLADAGAEAPPAEPHERPHMQVVTEPSSVTAVADDEEIPSPAVQPHDEDIEVTTPVGTTGAGPGLNPDTGESDLQQPGTEPLMDPSTTKQVKKESETLRKASDQWKD